MERLNVLITAASRRVPLVQAFQRALTAPGRRGSVIVTDVNRWSSAVHVAERWYNVPLATSPDYLDAIIAICDAERIGLIVPTIDDELELFGAAEPWFRARGIRVAVSPESTSRICNDKLAACRYLRDRGIRAAESWLPAELPEPAALPLFIKPRFGRGGVGAFRLRNQRELDFFKDYVATPIIQEYLDGPEFTIDLLCDFAHRPLAIVPRERVVVRAGVMDCGRTVDTPSLIALGEAVAAALPFLGAANIQCRMVDGEPVVFEINPRFSGGIPLTIAAGADFAASLVDLSLGRPVAPRIGRFKAGLWLTSYEASIFVKESAVSPGRPVPCVMGDVA